MAHQEAWRQTVTLLLRRSTQDKHKHTHMHTMHRHTETGAFSLTTVCEPFPDTEQSLHLNPGTWASHVLALLHLSASLLLTHCSSNKGKPRAASTGEWPLRSQDPETPSWVVPGGWVEGRKTAPPHREERVSTHLHGSTFTGHGHTIYDLFLLTVLNYF